MLGFTWHSLTGQINWDIRLRQIRGKENGTGLFTLNRQLQPAAAAFRDLATRYDDVPALQDFPIGTMQGPLAEPPLEDAVNAVI